MSRDVTAYRLELQALLPRGIVWARSEGATLTALLTALAEEFQRADERQLRLIDEADPRTTGELLPEWEATAGLPDPCITGDQTFQQRREALVARVILRGGASADYFVGIAEALGYVEPFVDYPGDTHVWRLNFQEDAPVSQFRAGANTAGERLQVVVGNEQIECLINRVKPAHTRCLFAYGVT